MILKIVPDSFGRMHNGNAKILQQSSRSYARDLQQLRRIGGTGRDNHLALRPCRSHFAIPQVVDSDGALTIEKQLCCERVGIDPEIAAL